MAKSESYVVGIDIGTSRICCVVGEVKEDGAVLLAAVQSTGTRSGCPLSWTRNTRITAPEAGSRRATRSRP